MDSCVILLSGNVDTDELLGGRAWVSETTVLCASWGFRCPELQYRIGFHHVQSGSGRGCWILSSRDVANASTETAAEATVEAGKRAFVRIGGGTLCAVKRSGSAYSSAAWVEHTHGCVRNNVKSISVCVSVLSASAEDGWTHTHVASEGRRGGFRQSEWSCSRS